MDANKLQRFQNRVFKQMVSYAYSVPLYHEKYKKTGIHPHNIKGIKDITKLPFITKRDLVENYPKRIIPSTYNEKGGFVICTGGTTGKPVSIYTDHISMGIAGAITIRELRHFNLHWRKSKFVHIGNFNQYRIDKIAHENFTTHLQSFISMKNRLNIDVNTPIVDIIKKLDVFTPDIIMAYPVVFQHLAYLRRNGYGNHIKPKLCWTGGAILDNYTRRYVQDAFGCPLLNIYPSVEAGGDIAFECTEGKWHIHGDFYYLEAINENNELVEAGKRGHVVLTKLWGKGTPIIRYTGMDDWVRLSGFTECACGLQTPTIKGGVEGRKRANIILPNGKVFPPGAFCFIEPVLHKLNTFKVKQYQIVQRTLYEIEILLVIDPELRNKGPSVDKIAAEIIQVYKGKVGPDVSVIVHEVDKIKGEKNASKPPPIVVSCLTEEEGYSVFTSKI
jgi:phenylacetate-CoA ligase